MYKSAMWPPSELAKTPISVSRMLKVKCDSNCPRYNSEGFCKHTIVVALKNKTIESFASALSKCNKKDNECGVTEDQKQCVWSQSTSSYQKTSSWKSWKIFIFSIHEYSYQNIWYLTYTTAAYDPSKMNDVSIITSFPSSFLNQLLKDIQSHLV